MKPSQQALRNGVGFDFSIPIRLVLGGVIILGLGIIFLFRFSFPPCFFYQATQLYCPGCGGTRALKALSEGQFFSAFHFHPLFPLLFPAGIGVGVSYFFWPKAFLAFEACLTPRWILFWVSMGVLFTVLRNLPGFPWELLRPA